MESNVYAIKKIKYTLGRFNVTELKPGPADNYEIGLDGTVKYYVTDYGCRKYRNFTKIKVPVVQVEQFFAEIRDVLAHAKYEYSRIDDTSRNIRITYSERHYEVLSADTATEDGRSIERIFWAFIRSIEK